MNFTYETQGTNTYMVYEIKEEEIIDSMSLGMITNNKIQGLAPAFFFQQDNTKYIKYNISAKVSAEQFLMGSVTKKRLIGVFSGIVNALISAEDYMIDTDSIFLDLRYIFTDVSTCETILICLPILDTQKRHTDIKAFLKNIMFSTQFDQTENCDYIAKLINYLNSASTFSLMEFKEVLDRINGMHTESKVYTESQQTVQSQVVQKEITKPKKQISESDLVQQTRSMQQDTKAINSNFTQSVIQPAQPTVTPPQSVISDKTQPSEQMGFAIPGQSAVVLKENKKKKEDSKKDNTNASTEEKEISFWYLMQHYNKENAAAYKAQKEAKKGQKEAKKKENKTKTDVVVPRQDVQVDTQTNIQTQENAYAVPNSNMQTVSNTSATQNVIQQQQNQNITMQQQNYTMHQNVTQSYERPANFGETTVLSQGSIGETMVLNQNMIPTETTPYLIRKKNSEKILLNKPVFRIGKERSYVDYFIGDNTAISRSHANIITNNGEYFVMDTNSTNHTYVDGMMIQSNVEVKLTHGVNLRLANEDFEFRLN